MVTSFGGFPSAITVSMLNASMRGSSLVLLVPFVETRSLFLILILIPPSSIIFYPFCKLLTE
ncbi:hypothetical protein Patl1_00029 [Pistacia atlantica]|uniref:Uncharacterized protein n=1 Tax=Pistacia atlantica TaxID=434234 RepID=A0ACC1C4W9_9ROSI|nr:hypothetical protein Patl1_00029 [Pistacia atlantica]